MTRNIICPWCRSTLIADGSQDFNAPGISQVKCPVCGFPIPIDSGFPISTRWTSLTIVNAVQPAQSWADFQKTNPQQAAALAGVPSSMQLSPYKDFSVVNGLETSLEATGKAVGAGVTIVTDAAKKTLITAADVASAPLTELLKNFATPLIIFGVFLLVFFLLKDK